MDEVDSNWNQIFFLLLVILGGLVLVNLLVAVVYIRFDQRSVTEHRKTLIFVPFAQTVLKQHPLSLSSAIIANDLRKPKFFWSSKKRNAHSS